MIRNSLYLLVIISFWSTKTNANPSWIGESSFKPQYFSPTRSSIQDERSYDYRREPVKYEYYDRHDNPDYHSRYPSRFDHKIDMVYKYYALDMDHRGMHGGRISIVPKRNNIPITFTSYDMLLEYLRIRNLANSNQHLRKNRANIGFGLREYQLHEEKTQPMSHSYQIYEEPQE